MSATQFLALERENELRRQLAVRSQARAVRRALKRRHRRILGMLPVKADR